MAFDGIITNAVVSELNKSLPNTRLEKIQMPSKNELILSFHVQRETLKVLISVDASNARVHFTNTQKENPVKAPQFCMVLRKYLQGAKLLSIEQQGLDRVIKFNFENLNELGDLTNYILYVELMGKYSNIILVNNSNKILDSIRHVDASMSSIREVLPAREYIAPTALHKQEFIGMDYERFIANLQVAAMDPFFEENNMSKFIANQFVGFSKLFVDNLLYQADFNGKFDKQNTMDMFNIINLILFYSNSHMLHLQNYKEDYHVNLNDYSTTIDKQSISKFLDNYYLEKEKNASLKTARFNLSKDVTNFVNKYTKNLKRAEEILAEKENMEKYRLYGELISANIYRIDSGLKEIELENYYDNNAIIKIPLDENRTASKNAQNYFKKYNKLKTALEHAEAQKSDYLANIDYLNSVLFAIETSSTTIELNEIKKELSETGYINYAVGKKKYKDEEALGPHKYLYGGIEILAGRNNLQNDKLTLKLSDKSYTWLHVKDHHGSHVIINSPNPSNQVIEYAAKIAVKLSEASESSKVSVDYTLVKYVHKPSGSKPGKVIYTNYKTIVI